jgi:menaquinone-dependent protoporphyrinogen oxidase
MSRLLILYGTTDGHTRKIANAVANTLKEMRCRVDVVNAADAGYRVSPENYDAVVVAASLHAQGYQKAVTRWVRAHAAELGRRPGAFVSVCLGILEKRPETRHQLNRIVGRFQVRLGWHPDAVKMVAGALPYTRYGWLKKWVMKRIVSKAGGDTDTSRDYEYTDWDDLHDFVRDFAQQFDLVPAAETLPVT